jgi:hypothetical protein
MLVTRRGQIFGGTALLSLAFALMAQRTATTTLVVRVDPETHVSPARVNLSFRVSADGASDVSSQTETVAAWVRSPRSQTIHLSASAAGTFPLSALRWSGTVTQATGGGQQASCTAGSFAGGVSQDLAGSWTRSGTIRCAVTFSLADPRSLAPGLYTGAVDIAIH